MSSMEMATAMVLSLNRMAQEAYSAQPGAPVIPDKTRAPWSHSVRVVLAAGLTRAARAVEPARQCSAA
jgi:hypothetical protein